MPTDRERAEALIVDGLVDVEAALGPGRAAEGHAKILAAGVLALFALADAIRATDPDAPQEDA